MQRWQYHVPAPLLLQKKKKKFLTSNHHPGGFPSLCEFCRVCRVARLLSGEVRQAAECGPRTLGTCLQLICRARGEGPPAQRDRSGKEETWSVGPDI